MIFENNFITLLFDRRPNKSTRLPILIALFDDRIHTYISAFKITFTFDSDAREEEDEDGQPGAVQGVRQHGGQTPRHAPESGGR